MGTRKKKLTCAEIEQQDFDYILNSLRRASVTWSGRAEALRLARRPVVVRLSLDGDPIYKFEWECAKCNKWFRNIEDLEVDHIHEVAGDRSAVRDWTELLERIKRLYARPVGNHLQVLCKVCHQRKTASYMNATKRYTRK